MVEDRRAAPSNGETQLVEREGERHPHRFIELFPFTLMHNRDHEVVGFDLELFERLESLRRVRLTHEIKNALQQTQPPRARVAAQIARHAGQRRTEYGKDQHAVEYVVAVSVE